MANTVSILNYANTFGDWVVTTNALVKENNTLASTNYTKSIGTLYLSDLTLGLQVANNAIFGGQLQSQGIGSSAVIQNNLTVTQGQVYFANTTLGLNNAGQLIVGGLLNATGPALGLSVSNNTGLGGYLRVAGNTVIANTLNVTGPTTVSNTVSISLDTTVGGNVIAQNYVNVTKDVNAVNFNALNFFNGYGLSIIGNGTLTNNLTVGGYANIGSNTAIGTNLSVGGNEFVSGNTTIANNLTVAKNTLTNSLTSNTSINTSLLNTSGSTYTNTLNANGYAYIAGTLNVGGSAYVNTLTSNGAISAANLTLSGTSLSATGVTGNFQALTTTGSVTVGGNFVLTGQTVYATNTFTLSAGVGSPVSSYFNVYRPSASNASIRWNETQQYFELNDVNNNNYYRIHTDEYSSDTTFNYGTKNIATSNAVSYLQGVANTTNTNLLSSVTNLQNQITSNVNSLQSQITSNVNSLQAQISSNVAYISGIDNTQNTWVGLAWTRANSSAQVFNGTSGSASPTSPSGVITLTSTNGVTITGSGNTLVINDAQDLRTTASPSFSGLTLSTTPLSISSGGTGATSSGAALTALLPTGTTSGYVLTTGGPGSFYWAAGGTGGGVGAVPGTTINSTRQSYTANGNGFAYSTPIYIPGDSQLRVYIDGVRQFPSEYTETSGNTNNSGIVTFNSSPQNGTQILFEVDGYIINPYYANNIAYTINSTISPTANTIQTAIDGLASIVAVKSGTTFTGPIQAPNPTVGTSNTQVATTSYVNSFANSGITFAHNISGSAPAGSLTGSSLSSGVTGSSLTSVGTLTSGALGTGFTTIALAQGGTGQTTAQSAMNSFAGATTSGYYLRGNGTNVVMAQLGAGDLTGTIPSTVLGNSTHYIGTTAIALNRASASQSLTGINIDGSAGTFTSTSQNSQFNSLGVGTSASGTAGEIRATNNITAYYSDDRLKTRLGNIENALDKLMTLNGFRYEANETAQALGYEVKPEIGLSAQEVQAVLPEVVVPAPIDDKYLTIHYERVIPLLVEAIKELKAEIDVLKGNNK